MTTAVADSLFSIGWLLIGAFVARGIRLNWRLGEDNRNAKATTRRAWAVLLGGLFWPIGLMLLIAYAGPAGEREINLRKVPTAALNAELDRRLGKQLKDIEQGKRS